MYMARSKPEFRIQKSCRPALKFDWQYVVQSPSPKFKAQEKSRIQIGHTAEEGLDSSDSVGIWGLGLLLSFGLLILIFLLTSYVRS
jgi:hypothetical protein